MRFAWFEQLNFRFSYDVVSIDFFAPTTSKFGKVVEPLVIGPHHRWESEPERSAITDLTPMVPRTRSKIHCECVSESSTSSNLRGDISEGDDIEVNDESNIPIYVNFWHIGSPYSRAKWCAQA